ncbi:SDR family oxidoreductase [Muricoccus pecuniae]|uniref:NAD(P)-dependent dehydrogenase (Short-subunit alcohol dehydrogenase family) n=1 Tax=Muricoccus pecuniae TaxID=693023 RepID=A0A840Y310_9PROT|nr:SDR family oxidoreductase [Roseomonas pecuniae]MBB5695498.1 NAD(P)-dependent dehydrogenase (short-subunit alcohol dehydrogenase family) [Roseomonas pecuniae]
MTLPTPLHGIGAGGRPAALAPLLAPLAAPGRPPAPHWTTSNMPPQQGRLAVITGTGGLGLEDALALVRAGAMVVIAGRDANKGFAAVGRIKAQLPDARVRFRELDLASLESVHRFADRLAREEDGLDLLVNNAGVMTPPERCTTADGLELQFGTNHLGHFALTARLLPLLRRRAGSRVISLGSVAARGAAIDFADLQSERRYQPMAAYGQSKLACLLFAFELSRRSRAAGWGVASLAAHPGIARTDLIPNGAGRRSLQGRVRSLLPFLFQPAWQGALPTLYAATAPSARDGAYYGPHAWAGTRGYPAEERAPKQALDEAAAARLWELSEEMAHVAFA